MTKPLRFGLLFGLELVLAWAVATPIVARLLWLTRHEPLLTLVQLVLLWMFTILAPTITAFRLRRDLMELSTTSGPPSDEWLRRVAAIRPMLLIAGLVALLSAIALIHPR